MEDDLDELDEGLDPRTLDEEDVTERTPLVSRTSVSSARPFNPRDLIYSPAVMAFVLGLFVGLVKPVQRWLFRITLDTPNGSWLWQSVGWGVSVLGTLYFVLDIVRFGATLRETDTHL